MNHQLSIEYASQSLTTFAYDWNRDTSLHRYDMYDNSISRPPSLAYHYVRNLEGTCIRSLHGLPRNITVGGWFA